MTLNGKISKVMMSLFLYALCDSLIALEIGEEGPAGGIVFYISEDGTHGLEAARTDLAASKWCSVNGIIGELSDEVGKGKSNTEKIVEKCIDDSSAAKVAYHYRSPNGVDDWFLPSKKELELMYKNLAQYDLGDFSKSRYWSSSESNIRYAWQMIFGNGYLRPERKGSAYLVRPIREF